MLNRVKTKLASLRGLLEEKESRVHLNLWQSVTLQAVLSVLIELFIEACSRHSVKAALSYAVLHTHAFVYNCLLIFLTSLAVFLVRRRRLLLIFICGVWMAGGIANGVVLSGRVTPFTGPDFKNYTEALGIIDKYLDSFEIVLLIAAAIAAGIGLVIYFFRCPRYKGKMHYRLTAVILAGATAGFLLLTNVFISNHWLSSYFGNIAFAYQDYGFPYCFMTTLLNTGVSKPRGYSEASVQNILNESQELPATVENTNALPNIIVVQLESFFDVSRVNYLETSEDPLPNWHELSEHCSSGFYTVPSIGAGTANTEFETLTGMSMHFFGAGEYPFKGILKENTCESSAYVLKDLGYSCFGLHNNEANFYSRKKVYKNLGFDAFVSGEYMQNQDDINENGWMRDENLIQPIMDCLDSTKGHDYIFTVSVQPHGSYPTEEVLEDPLIQVSGQMSEERRCQWEYYVNQLHEEDQFVADLIAAVRERGEQTVVFFYGDHLPTLGLLDEQLTSGNTYQTEWLMWDNCGMSVNNRDIAAYQAIATIFEDVGIHEGTVFRYQQVHKGDEPDYNVNLQTLQYDLLYGEQYAYALQQRIPESNPNYRLGVNDITITGFEPGPEGTWVIHGTNFTQSCKVSLNRTLCETVWISDTSLLVLNTELNVTDRLRIGVQSNSKTHKILTYSKPYYVTYNTLHAFDDYFESLNSEEETVEDTTEGIEENTEESAE